MEDKHFIADKETLDHVDENVTDIKTTGENTKTVVDKCYDILSADGVYGFIEHNAILSPSQRIEYIGMNKGFTPLTVTMGGGFSLGGWADFPVLKNNKPWMVKNDGTPDYELLATDYTKKAVDGTTASDVANTSYAGGAFSWLQKIYKKEYMSGDDRYVLFSLTKKEGFEPVGFVDSSDKELEGVWLPMFYNTDGTTKATCIGTGQPEYNNGTAAQKTAIDAFGSRAKFFGGAIINTIVDLLIMFAKTTDLQGAYGKGNQDGYDSTASPTYGVKANTVIGGGQFYGTSDGKSLNKIFHSIVLGSYQQWMRDPYTACVSGKLYVSKNYTYDISTPGSTYQPAGIDYTQVGDTSWHYPHKYVTVPGFGAVPSLPPYNGSTVLGGCDGFIVNAGIAAVGRRFGGCANGARDGVRALDLTNAATHAYWNVGSAVLLLPPVGVAA